MHKTNRYSNVEHLAVSSMAMLLPSTNWGVSCPSPEDPASYVLSPHCLVPYVMNSIWLEANSNLFLVGG
jgi:hypothetical protein